MIIPEQRPPAVAAPPETVRPAPPGARYDHLARSPGRRWYVGPAALAFFVAAYLFCVVMLAFVVFFLAGLAGVPLDALGLPADEAWMAAYTLLSVVVALPVLLFVIRFLERRRPAMLSSVTGRLRFGWLAVCLVPAFVLTAGVAIVFELIAPTEAPFVGWPAFLGVVAVAVLCTPLQAATEEYVFRGWLVQSFGAVMRSPWLGVLVSAALFASVHEGALTNVWGFADLMLFAVILSVVTIGTGGLEAAVVLHVMHNVTSWVFTAAFGTTTAIADYSGVEPVAIALTAVPMVLYAGIVLVMARRRGLETRSAGDMAGLPAPRPSAPV